MLDQQMIPKIVGRTAFDRDGKKLGQVGQVYVDDNNGSPVWATVNTGMFGTKESFVPLSGAAVSERDVQLAVAKDVVKDAPHVDDSGDHISPQAESELNRHYSGWMGREQAGPTGDGRADGAGHDRAGHDGRGTGNDEGMVRSEEHLRVGTESVETGRVRLRKYVVTDEEQVTVPVRREEVRVEREPIRGGERVGRDSMGEQEQEVTLHAERPVVDKDVEAVERVRLGTETVSEDQTVSDTVAKERIEVDDPQHQVRDRRS